MKLSPVTAVHLSQLERYLSSRRLEHSIKVAQAARKLARRFAADLVPQAELAGLLHDNAKGLSNTELMTAAGRFDIQLSTGEVRQPALLHGKVGAALLPERFEVVDPEIAQAVADHVTGRTNMGVLSCILFVADQLAADRVFPGVKELRSIAREDLNRAALLVAKHKLLYNVERERLLEPMTVLVYNELLNKVQANGAD